MFIDYYVIVLNNNKTLQYIRHQSRKVEYDALALTYSWTY